MGVSAVGRYRQDKPTVRVNKTRYLIDLPRFLRYGLQVFLDAG